MESVKAKCPHCGRSLKLNLQDAGLTMLCPACGQRFAVPARLRPPPMPGTGTATGHEPSQPVPRIGPTGTADGSEDRGDALFTPNMVVGVAIGGGVLIGTLVVAVLLYVNRAPTVVVAPPPPPPPAAFPTGPASPTETPSSPPAATRPAATAPAPLRRGPAAATEPAEAVAVATRPATEPVVARGLVPVKPPHPAESEGAVLDEQIGHAIVRATDFLIGHFEDGLLPEAKVGDGESAGRDALAVYAVLQAAKATDRPDLAVDSKLAGQMLTALTAMPMRANDTTYDRSLRASALAIYDRPADRHTLVADALFLERGGRGGGYTYDEPDRKPEAALAAEENGDWDNSNSQYGALGVWAAEDAGVPVPSQYWANVRRHWVKCQRDNGQWGYSGFNGRDAGELSMTVAGVTMMLVAEDHLGVGSAVDEVGRPPYTPTVTRALAWLDRGDNAVKLPGDWPAYTLYGLERAGLASGLKSFGRHDWYRELAAQRVLDQGTDGSWGNIVDTSFTLLFLARGRHPLLFDKLQFDGAWANRPRDVANLAAFAAKALERPFNWQVVSVHDDWQTWTDAPVLFIASHAPLPLTDEEVDKLRSYAEAGGLIFTSADAGSASFDRYVSDLSARLFPGHPLHDLPADDPVYRSLFPLGKATHRPPLRGVSNGSRLLLVHSPADLGRTWQLHESIADPPPFRVGLNVFIYAAGKSSFLNRLGGTYLPAPPVKPIATRGVARVVYDGDWDPEPAAAGRFARQFLGDTSIRVRVDDVDAAALDARKTPLALLSGTGRVHLSPVQLKAVHDYVAAGGVLLVDACGGAGPFAASARGEVLPHAFGTAPFTDLPADHPILAGTAPGMAPVDLRLRQFAEDLAGARQMPVESLAVGNGLVLFCPVDVTTGLLGTRTWAVNGYQPDVAYGLVRNALLWSVERPGW